jgi:hypothetical protein
LKNSDALGGTPVKFANYFFILRIFVRIDKVGYKILKDDKIKYLAEVFKTDAVINEDFIHQRAPRPFMQGRELISKPIGDQ